MRINVGLPGRGLARDKWLEDGRPVPARRSRFQPRLDVAVGGRPSHRAGDFNHDVNT